MAEYLIQEESLKAIADVLRENTRTTGKIAVADMPGKINQCLDAMISGNVKASWRSEVTNVRAYAFYKCNIVDVELPNATRLNMQSFGGSTLTTINAPKVTSLIGAVFQSCNNLKTVTFPAVTSIGNTPFNACSALTTADFPKATSIGQSAFASCTALTALILRNSSMVEPTSNVTSSNYYPLKNTAIESGTGYIYVPAALVDAYKTADVWSAYADQFRALEDYTVDGTTTGALDETKIAA